MSDTDDDLRMAMDHAQDAGDSGAVPGWVARRLRDRVTELQEARCEPVSDAAEIHYWTGSEPGAPCECGKVRRPSDEQRAAAKRAASARWFASLPGARLERDAEIARLREDVTTWKATVDELTQDLADLRASK